MGLVGLAGVAPASAAPAPTDVFVWGYNARGGLGLGGTASSGHPLALRLDPGVTSVGVGVDHMFAVDSDGRLWGWGGNASGQLGDGSMTDRRDRVEVAFPAGTRIVQVSAYQDHAVALDADGGVWSWGRGHRGQLGDGTTTDRATPTRLALGAAAVAVEAGQEQSFAITVDGEVLAWGANDRGQLGDGTTTDRLAPVSIALPGSPRVTLIAAGTAFTAALTDDGRVFTWGALEVTGVPGVTSPTSAGDFDGGRIVALDAGDAHLIALDDSGAVWTWGDDTHGQLGTDGGSSSTPNRVAMSTASRVVAAGSFSLAVLADGSLLSWGWNRFGQLGDDTTTDRTAPAPVPALAGSEITGVAAGRDSVAVTVDRGPLATLSLSPSSATVAPGVFQTYEVRGLDAFGDDLGPIAGAVLSVQGGDCLSSGCRATAPGRHTVSAVAGAAVGVATLIVSASGGGGGSGGGGSSPAGGILGLTGVQVAGLVGAVVVLLALGGVAVFLGRRRRTERRH
jgi:alpha-tubulin suppressor-like RCC1 family protein